MTILGDYSVEKFLVDHWQKKPLLIKGASYSYENVLTADELAGMACEEQVESRLIIKQDDGRWALENGPLDENRFSELPETNWTLLVQSVDQWLPDVRGILNEFDFLPSWRLDDVMISYATPGGGVGPHFDYYDVFLLQTRGKRRWKLGQACDQNTHLLEGQPLKLLAEFTQVEEFDVEPGDMLYIPAGVAHWGIGLNDECMTWSIGFRAPSAKELLTGAIERLADKLPDDLRYKDNAESLINQFRRQLRRQFNGQRMNGQPNKYQSEIGSVVKQQLQPIRESMSEELLMDAMADVLGALSTEPRYPDLIEASPEQDACTHEELQHLFEQRAEFVRNQASRFAYSVNTDNESFSKLYVNGEVREDVSTELASLVCVGRIEPNTFDCQEGRELVLELINSGAYLVEVRSDS